VSNLEMKVAANECQLPTLRSFPSEKYFKKDKEEIKLCFAII